MSDTYLSRYLIKENTLSSMMNAINTVLDNEEQNNEIIEITVNPNDWEIEYDTEGKQVGYYYALKDNSITARYQVIVISCSQENFSGKYVLYCSTSRLYVNYDFLNKPTTPIYFSVYLHDTGSQFNVRNAIVDTPFSSTRTLPTAITRLANYPDEFIELDLNRPWFGQISGTSLNFESNPFYKSSTYELTSLGAALRRVSTIDNTEIPAQAFRSCTNLTSISVPKVTSIGEAAFADCTGLSGVIQMAYLKPIGKQAFQNCRGITEFYGQGVYDIGENAFSNCTGLTKIFFPGCNHISANAFYGCTELNDITIGFPSINNSAFYNTGLKELKLNRCYLYGSHIFENCQSLTTVELRTAYERPLEEQTFANCTALTTITLSNFNKIGDSAFLGDTALTTCTFGVERGTADCITIGKNAFANCIALNTINLAKIQNISQGAFYNCHALTTIDLETCKSLDISTKDLTIQPGPFTSCTNLSTINNFKVEDIPAYCFAYCTSLKTINLSNTHTIGKSAFFICSQLNIECSSPYLRRIDEGAFEQWYYDKPTMTGTLGPFDIYSISSQGASELTIGNKAFALCSINKIDGARITSIGEEAFRDCVNLTQVRLSQCQTIGDMAFDNCHNLSNFIFENSAASLTNIGWGACRETAIPFIDFPYISGGDENEEYISIDSRAFAFCTKLSYFNGQRVKGLGAGVFTGCTSLTSVNIQNVAELKTWPEHVEYEYRDGIFEGCTNLKVVTLNENITTIPEKTFKNCAQLATIQGQAKYTSIGDEAFYSCYYLPEINLEECEYIGTRAFQGCRFNLYNIILDKCTYLGDYAFASCGFINNMPTLNPAITSIPSGLFANTTRFNGFKNGGPTEGFTTIGYGAFDGVIQFPELGYLAVRISKNTTSIGQLAFAGTTLSSDMMTDLTGLTFIGQGAFARTNINWDLVIPNVESFAGTFAETLVPTATFENAKTIGEYTFSNCTALTKFIGNKVQTISTRAFYNCTALTSFNSPALTSLGGGFEGCTALTTINIPKCEYISPYAFQGCNNLTTIYLNSDSVPSTGITKTSLLGFGGNIALKIVVGEMVDQYKANSCWAPLADHIVASI